MNAQKDGLHYIHMSGKYMREVFRKIIGPKIAEHVLNASNTENKKLQQLLSESLNHHFNDGSPEKPEPSVIRETMLMIDLDGKNALDDFFSRIWIIKGIGLNPSKVSVYETKNGFHIYLENEVKLDPMERFFFQTCLGSDYRKELFGYFRYRRGLPETEWNVLFKEKQKVMFPGCEIVTSEEIPRPDLTRLLANKIESGIRRNLDEIDWTELKETV